VAVVNQPALHPTLTSLAGLVGEWTGHGHGSYPTIEDFDYIETVTFTSSGKAFLAYSQRTSNAVDGSALHTETGYLRSSGGSGVELVVASPTGVAEIDEGVFRIVDDATLHVRLVSRQVIVSSTAKSVTDIERTFTLKGDLLSVTLAMAAVGQPVTHHLSSQLRRSV